MPSEYELRLLKELVEIDTDSSRKANYGKIADLLKHECEDLGAEATLVSTSAPISKENPELRLRPNLFARIDNGADRTLALNTHYDVVPTDAAEWKTNPFELKTIGNKAYGRGSCDAKGCIAAMLGAVKDAKSRTNVEIILACDEETGSEYGTKYVIEKMRKRIKSDSAVVLDDRPLLAVGASGGVSGLMTFRGKGIHAGYPFAGKNAIYVALDFLSGLKKFERIGEKEVSRYKGIYLGKEKSIYVRYSPTVIRAGEATNLIPGTCSVKFDLRCTPEGSTGQVTREFRNLFDKVKKVQKADAEMRILFSHEPYATDEHTDIVRRMQRILGRKLYGGFVANDATYFQRAGIPAISYGVFNDSAHKSNEYVSLSDLESVKRNVVRLLESY